MDTNAHSSCLWYSAYVWAMPDTRQPWAPSFLKCNPQWLLEVSLNPVWACQSMWQRVSSSFLFSAMGGKWFLVFWCFHLFIQRVGLDLNQGLFRLSCLGIGTGPRGVMKFIFVHFSIHILQNLRFFNFSHSDFWRSGKCRFYAKVPGFFRED